MLSTSTRRGSDLSRVTVDAVPLPHAIARFNKRVTNRFIEPLARRSAGFAVVHHSGRRSGAPYTTPVNVFAEADGGALLVALTYGPSADWARNVLDGGGVVEDSSGVRVIQGASVVDRSVAWPALPALVRGALTVLRVTDFMRLTVSQPAAPSESR